MNCQKIRVLQFQQKKTNSVQNNKDLTMPELLRTDLKNSVIVPEEEAAKWLEEGGY